MEHDVEDRLKAWEEATRYADELRLEVRRLVEEGLALPAELVRKLARAEAELMISLEAVRRAQQANDRRNRSQDAP